MRIVSIAILLAIVTVAPAQTFGGPIVPLPIPDGVGTCGAGPSVTDTSVVVPPYGAGIGSITITLGVTHSWYGDLNVVITSPNGTSVHLLGFACSGFGDGSDLAGIYTIDDAAATTFDAAAVAAGIAVPAGTYKGDNLLTPFLCEDPTGVWTFTYYDHAGGDVGVIADNAINITPAAAGTCAIYTITQPTGAGSVLVSHSGGIPGATVVAPVVATFGGPPAMPGGWFLGLVIPWNDFINEIAGAPFYTTLDAAGNYSFGIPVGVPTGIVVTSACYHFHPVTGAPSYQRSAFTLTTL